MCYITNLVNKLHLYTKSILTAQFWKGQFLCFRFITIRMHTLLCHIRFCTVYFFFSKVKAHLLIEYYNRFSSMKLTPLMVADAPTFINPVGERTISLRSLTLSDLDIGISQLLDTDIFECIDLTDNDLIIVPDFPASHRLKTLLLARNRIRVLSHNFASELYNLETVSLINNFIRSPKELTGITTIKNLKELYLSGNPITNLKHYRLWVIWKFPTLKILDFEKVKKDEKEKATKLFGTHEKPTEIAVKISKSTVDLGLESEIKDTKEKLDSDTIHIQSTVQRLSTSQRKKLKQELVSATKLADIERIQSILKRGYLRR